MRAAVDVMGGDCAPADGRLIWSVRFASKAGLDHWAVAAVGCGGIETCSLTIFQLPSFPRWKTSVKRALTVGRAAPAATVIVLPLLLVNVPA